MQFSILVAAYQHEATIAGIIRSCLTQDFSDFEIIVSDDCSSDETWSIVNSFESSKIRCFRQEKNIGEYSNRNFLISKATGV